MQRVQLIHWKAEEAQACIARLKKAGCEVRFEVPGGPAFLKQLRRDPPAVVVIDLTRLPSQGRDMALAIRQSKVTRCVPLVLVEGDPEKVARFKEVLPDATYTTWSRIKSALKRAVDRPPAQPAVPQSVMAGYSGTPLPKKLGIKADSVVDLAGAPEEFEQTLGELPEGARLRRRSRGPCSLTIWFVRSRRDLQRGLKRAVRRAEHGPVWIAWPKKASGMATDLTQQMIREAGLGNGLVDYKICAIDATWSGLRFVVRVKDRPKKR